jgi:hypothetical protein
MLPTFIKKYLLKKCSRWSIVEQRTEGDQLRDRSENPFFVSPLATKKDMPLPAGRLQHMSPYKCLLLYTGESPKKILEKD